MTKSELITEVSKRLAGEVDLPHKASTIGYYLFLLFHNFGAYGDEKVEAFRSKFLKSLPDWDFADLLQHQMDYAKRIADSEGELEYEDMFKLLSLCDEIYGLEKLGLTVPLKQRIAFEESVRKCFALNKHTARFAAEDLVEDWKRDLWWYSENLME